MKDIKQQYKTKNILPQVHELETEASNMKKNIVDEYPNFDKIGMQETL